ncbi:hypothetical protein ACIQTU_12265 [Brevundimonas sp. NPDC090276]|uniref:hypothetical protein n=1 Tax=Brevundimonas sp. NPDC090276 TaxID=3363956 RepID=UPI00383A1172
MDYIDLPYAVADKAGLWLADRVAKVVHRAVHWAIRAIPALAFCALWLWVLLTVGGWLV